MTTAELAAPPAEERAQAEYLLEARKIEVTYDRVAIAIQGVSLGVPAGGRVALLGTNGAGKSTTLRALTGFLPSEEIEVTDGEVIYEGESLVGLRPHEIARRGIALVPEREKVFMTLKVMENLLSTPVGSNRASRAEGLERVFHFFPQLERKTGLIAGLLSGGERQMLALGMALMTNPRLLLIDEMSLGLAPVIVEELVGVLSAINRELGVGLLVVEQNAEVALGLADHAYIIESGRIVLEGTPQRLREHEDVQEFYLGCRASRDGEAASYQDVKQYRRKRRWYG